MAEKVVLFLGSGFSANLGLPVTSTLQNRLLDVPANRSNEEQLVEAFIIDTISDFWKEVFGWAETPQLPAIEDHFTQIDLAANSGHYLGKMYGPKKLRALRRMTIHRVFRLLDVVPKAAPHVDKFVENMAEAFELSVVTTNWDIMAERCLEKQGRSFYYSRQVDARHPTLTQSGIPVWKLHGSGNWGYCDLCRALITSDLDLGKSALRFGWLLEAEDFRLFRDGAKVANELRTQLRECLSCGGHVAARVATFSYRKHLDVPFFQSIWDDARESLRAAGRWLFVGYSLPEADIEIRHLLKTAELAHSNSARPRIDIILKSDHDASVRYQRMFGKSIATISHDGIEPWVSASLPDYCR